MGHEIDITDGQAGFASNRADAQGRVDGWHKLGTAVPEGMDIETALDAAHMADWNVRKLPLTGVVVYDELLGRNVTVDVPDKFITVRTNPIRRTPGNEQVDGLGVVGRIWTPFQNETTAGLLNDIVDASGAHVETIGSLRGGRDTFITMLMPDFMEFRSPITGKVDKTELYLSILNNHTGEYPLRALISPVRIVCANTQKMAEGCARSSAVLRHTGEPGKRLEEIRAMLGMTFKYRDAFDAEMTKLIAAQVDEDFVRAALNDVFGVTDAPSELAARSRVEKVTQVMEVYRQSDTVADFRGTAFGAYNAVTEYVDHLMPVGRKGDESRQRAIRTLTSPDAAKIKSDAFTALLPA